MRIPAMTCSDSLTPTAVVTCAAWSAVRDRAKPVQWAMAVTFASCLRRLCVRCGGSGEPSDPWSRTYVWMALG
jgi:hypothetical protein